MTRRRPRLFRIFFAAPLICLLAPCRRLTAGPVPAANSTFDSYVRAVESRLAGQHRSQRGFLAPFEPARLRAEELIVERLVPADAAHPPGAMLHHWRGTAFAPGATAADFERLLRDFDSYPRHFSPQVTAARVLAQETDRVQTTMRVRQQHGISIVMDTTYDVAFGRLDSHRGYSTSRSTRIAEIAAPGTASEHVLSLAKEHGFLWRQNTYWSWEESDGGLVIQIESISLSRSIPHGLGWAISPFVESVPRDTLEFTLRAAVNALRKPANRGGK